MQENRDAGTSGGPSLNETMEAMMSANKAIETAIASCHDSLERLRLDEVNRRFQYGRSTYQLYDGLIGTALDRQRGDEQAARSVFRLAVKAADQLQEIHDLVQVASTHANAADGLEASGVKRTYDFFFKLYGDASPPAPG